MSKPSEIDEAFRLLDRNGDGHISAAEMREFLDKMGTDVVSKAEVDAIMKNCDRDNSGTIDAAEFKEMWNFLKSEATGAANDSEKIIRDEFEKLDKNKDGYISKEEMLTLLTTLSFAQATEEAAKKCVEDLDADGDGRISFPEFLLAWKFKQ